VDGCVSALEERRVVKLTELGWRIRVSAQQIGKLLLEDSGQDLIEYALVMVLITLAATAGMAGVAADINAFFVKVGSKLTGYTS
jgi:Flp pilus assembly pilin Flp